MSISFGDEVSGELDRRKVNKLVDDGVISPEELANAPIIMLVCPNDAEHGLLDDASLCASCKIEPIETEL